MVFGGLALAEKSAADDLCDGSRCSQEGLDGHDTANALAWASNITTGVGLAAVVEPISGEAEAPAAARRSPALGPWLTSTPDSALLGLSGSF